MDLLKMVSEHSATRPDAIAVSDRRGPVSYHELESRSDALARRLMARGTMPGDRVGLLSETSADVAVSLVAVLKAGAVFVPLNPRAETAGLERLLGICAPTALIASERYADLAGILSSGADRIAMVPIRADEPALGAGEDNALPFPSVGEDADATLVFSSGTGGLPKGVVSSRRKFSHLLRQHVTHFGVTSADRFHLTMPVFHYAGLAAVLGAGLVAGAQVVCFDGRFDAAKVIARSAAERITIEHWIPTTILRVVRHLEETPVALPHLRALHFGSMPISSELLARLRAVLDVELTQLYGSTDCGLIGRSCDLRKPGEENTLHLVADSGARLIAADGAEPKAGEVGEVAVSEAQSGMVRYWNDPGRTAATIRDGLIFSGDVARCLGSDRFELLGRRDGMIISGGENIYPAEVENIVASHPAVAEVCVVGKDDDEFGQAVVAVVRLAEGAELDLAGLRAFCREKCAAFLIPRGLRIVEMLPRTESGKIALSAVRSLVSEFRVNEI